MPVLRRTAVKTRSYAMPDTTMSLCGPSTWLTRAVHDDIVSRTTNSVLDDRLMAPIHVQDTSYSPTRHTKNKMDRRMNQTRQTVITSHRCQYRSMHARVQATTVIPVAGTVKGMLMDALLMEISTRL